MYNTLFDYKLSFLENNLSAIENFKCIDCNEYHIYVDDTSLSLYFYSIEYGVFLFNRVCVSMQSFSCSIWYIFPFYSASPIKHVKSGPT